MRAAFAAAPAADAAAPPGLPPRRFPVCCARRRGRRFISMIAMKASTKRWVLLSLGLWLPWAGFPAEPAAAPPETPAATAPAEAQPAEKPKAAADQPDPLEDLIAYAEKVRVDLPMLPGIYDGLIARLTANVLENAHYSRHPFNDEMSERFFQLYLDMLDPMHIHFTQQDIREFEKYRTTLDDLTRKEGNTSPAFEIFARFLQRLDQRVTQAAEDLKRGGFRFDTDETYDTDREKAPYPASLDEARALWRKHLRYEYLTEKLDGKKPEEIVDTLARRYKRTLRLLAEFDSDDVIQLYLSALAHAYDPHSDYMGKAQLDNFAISMKLSLFGIGALLSDRDGYCTIESLIPEGPAERSKKLKPKDRIVAVQQEGGEPVDVVGMKLQDVVELIRGPKGTKVTLTIIPADASDSSVRRQVTLVRDEIKLRDQQAKAEIIDLRNAHGRTNRIGLIDLPSFYASMDLGDFPGETEPRSTTEDVAALIRKLEREGVEGIILDLRRNGGGSLEEAIRLTGLFIDQGPVVQVRDTAGEVRIESDRDPGMLYSGPLVVLTSRFSASASEILAAALQDYGRALVVGDIHTHGKGTVQTIFELARSGRFPPSVNPGAIKITIRKFYRANGESTQLRGVEPDIVLPSVNNLLDVGEVSLDYALPWDHIASADYEPLNWVQPLLPELKRRTLARQKTDPDFAYVREDMEEYRKHQNDKTVSLNEEVRRREKEEAEARKKAREKERASRPPFPEVRYEITLEHVNDPGLPKPIGEEEEQASAGKDDDGSDTSTALTAASGSEEEAEAAHPTVDVTLRETKRILLDFIELMGQPGSDKKTRPVAVTTAR
ncbi:MAG: tail-specific protease [Verrucomicrobia bacterium]|nr:MAG: tail-specific protease [Verrucomicrobiota bacterium]